MPKESSYLPIHEALLCGQRLPPDELRANLASAGLIHLFVVSGLHIHLIGSFFTQAAQSRSLSVRVLSLVPLMGYGAVCQFSPPVMRALITHFLVVLSPHWSKSAPYFYKVPLVGLLCLVIEPTWISSMSFILSWIAALIISIPNLNIFFKNTALYLALLVPLSGIGPPTPASIGFNILVTPIIVYFAFPLTLLSSFLTDLIIFSDSIWKNLISLLGLINFSLATDSAKTSINLVFIWLYLLTLTGGVWAWEVQKRRNFFRK